MEIVSGTEIANEIKNNLKAKNEAEGLEPCLAIILVGDDRDSMVYVGLKKKALAASGGRGEIFNLPAGISREELLKTIADLNADPAVDGILVQLPLPGELASCQEEVLGAIDPDKDVDGFAPVSRGHLLAAQPGFISCAALACMDVAERVMPDLKDKKVLLIGDSFDVIKSLALMFIDRQCQVMVNPVYNKELAGDQDIVVIEKGAPLVVKGADLKEGALVIDAGFHWHNNRVCGNVDNDSTAGKAGFLLPVPGGMGPLLIAKLMENLNLAARGKDHA